MRTKLSVGLMEAHVETKSWCWIRSLFHSKGIFIVLHVCCDRNAFLSRIRMIIPSVELDTPFKCPVHTGFHIECHLIYSILAHFKTIAIYLYSMLDATCFFDGHLKLSIFNCCGSLSARFLVKTPFVVYFIEVTSRDKVPFLFFLCQLNLISRLKIFGRLDLLCGQNLICGLNRINWRLSALLFWRPVIYHFLVSSTTGSHRKCHTSN